MNRRKCNHHISNMVCKPGKFLRNENVLKKPVDNAQQPKIIAFMLTDNAEESERALIPQLDIKDGRQCD